MPLTVKAVVKGQRSPDFIKKSGYTSKVGACAPKKRAHLAKGCFGKLFFKAGTPHIQMCNGARPTGEPFAVNDAKDATQKIRKACAVKGKALGRYRRRGRR